MNITPKKCTRPSTVLVLPIVLIMVMSTPIMMTSGQSLDNNRVDNTIVKKAKGLDVVVASLDKIKAHGLFPDDHDFFRRMAFIESNFGTEDETYRRGFYGGIWQIDQTQFDRTKDTTNYPQLTPIVQKIQGDMALDWSSVKWVDLRMPLFSALAAMLYASTLGQPIPLYLRDQARYWSVLYRQNQGGVSEAEFIQKIIAQEKATECPGKMDMVVVLDESGSVPAADFRVALDFTAKLFESYALDSVRPGMITYDTTVRPIFGLGQVNGPSDLRSKIINAPHHGGGTSTNAALLGAVSMFGQAAPRSGVPRVMALFTDGHSGDGVTNSAQVKAAGVTSFAVGIGGSINKAELEQIAEGDQSHVFTLSDFDSLKEFLHRLHSETCKAEQQPNLNSTTVDRLKSGERRFYTFRIPTNGLILVLTNPEGVRSVLGFWSYTYKTPSSALHDGPLKYGRNYIPAPKRSRRRGQPKMVDNGLVYITIQGRNTAVETSYSIEVKEKQVSEIRGGNGGNNVIGAGSTFVVSGGFMPQAGNGVGFM